MRRSTNRGPADTCRARATIKSNLRAIERKMAPASRGRGGTSAKTKYRALLVSAVALRAIHCGRMTALLSSGAPPGHVPSSAALLEEALSGVPWPYTSSADSRERDAEGSQERHRQAQAQAQAQAQVWPSERWLRSPRFSNSIGIGIGIGRDDEASLLSNADADADADADAVGSEVEVYRNYVEAILLGTGTSPISSELETDTDTDTDTDTPNGVGGDGKMSQHAQVQDFQDVQGILNQSLCMPQSRFLNWESTADYMYLNEQKSGKKERQMLRDLAFRLTYLALYHHQHRPAAAEARTRLGCLSLAAPNSTCLEVLRQAGAGPYDYECRDAKYLVSWVGKWGLGANLRNMMTYSLLQALVTGRVLLLMNSVSVPGSFHFQGSAKDKDKAMRAWRYLKQDWPLASCDRGDLQCVFLPLSPCVLTHDDLAEARVLNWTQQEHLRWNRAMPPGRGDDRVLIVGNDVGDRDKRWRRGTRNARQLRDVVVDLVRDLYRERGLSGGGGVGGAVPWNLSESTLGSVFDMIRTDEFIVDDAALFYFTRLNLRHRQKLEALTAEVLPRNYQPESAIGIAVRSSDKCLRESECLDFDQYMKVARGVARKANERNALANNPQVDSIILTSESMTILNSRFDYPRRDSFPYEFVVNAQDSAQGTGEPGEYKFMEHFNITADDIMFSTIAALRLQLLGGATVGNCCSSFHNMIRTFLDRGCGAAKHSHFECLQDNENPEYRICCFNKRRGQCGEKFKQGYNGSFVEGSDVLRPDIDPSNLGRKARFVYDQRQNRVKKYQDELKSYVSRRK